MNGVSVSDIKNSGFSDNVPIIHPRGVVDLDAYQRYPETNRSTQMIDTGSGYDITNDNNYSVVYDAKINTITIIRIITNTTI